MVDDEEDVADICGAGGAVVGVDCGGSPPPVHINQ